MKMEFRNCFIDGPTNHKVKDAREVWKKDERTALITA
jgi:hypothetical protein